MRKGLINILDNSFVIFVVFLFNFLWCRYFFNLWIALIVSLILTLILSLLFLYLKSNKKNKDLTNKNIEGKILGVKNFLIYNPFNKVKELLVSKLKATFVEENICEIKGIYYYVFPGILNANDLIKILKENKVSELNLICAEICKDATEIIKNIEKPKIKTFDSKQLVLEFNLDIENIQSSVIVKTKNAFTFKEFLALFVREENAKGYLIGAIILMLSILIIKQKIYYYIFVSILLILSLICKIKPQILDFMKNKKS